MTYHPFAPLSTTPIERLHVYDGLMMNAHRWLLAEKYHRDRQNLHYQSLHQPGIVFGLGVKIKPPDESPLQCRGRLLEIQPGIAIDVAGNLIIIDQPTTYPIATEAPAIGASTVYLSVSYVEPDSTRPPEEITIREWFRFDETTTLPTDEKVELCRIQLQPGTTRLEVPEDVFSPQINQLDLRQRRQAQVKSQAFVRIAQVEDGSAQGWNSQIQKSFSYLIQSLSALYPAMQGAVETIKSIDLQPSTGLKSIDLLYLTGWQILSFEHQAFDAIKDYLEAGGGILIEAPHSGIDLESVRQRIVRELSISLQPWQDFSQNSALQSLRTQPFLFAALPAVYEQPIQVWAKSGVVLAIGELSAAWGLGDGITLSRQDIRTAQEFAINVLFFTWKRRQLMQLMR